MQENEENARAGAITVGITVVTCAVAVVYAIVIIEALSVHKKDLYDVANDFQGLVAGMLALAAAYFTIRAMHRTDQEQGLRHSEAMELGLQTEYRMLERAINPQILGLRSQRIHLWEMWKDNFRLKDTPAGRAVRQETITPLVEKAKGCAETVQELMDREVFVEGRKVFPGNLEHICNSVTIPTTRLLETVQNIMASAEWADGKISNGQASKFLWDVNSVAVALEPLVEELEKTYKRIPDRFK